jgi:omega-amidase
MPENLKIELIQTHLYWEDAAANLNHLSQKINSITHETDIIVLPEMFTTGFTMKPSILAEETDGQGIQWMIKTAALKQSVITGSISVKENGNYYNRLYWVFPDGKYHSYDKRHLFRMGNEHLHYSAGQEKLIIEYKGWKICPLVCYDLRFPVWSRNTKENTYDVLIYVANWPAVRSYPWKQLLIARAIENQSYVVGVNRIGEDGNQIPHSGDSCVISPKGELLSKDCAFDDTIISHELNYKDLFDFRIQFPAIMDADNFNVIV